MKKMSDIQFGDAAERIGKWLSERSYTKVAVLTDDHTKQYCLPKLGSLSVDLSLNIPHGESNKQISTCTYLWKEMLDANIDRNSLLINLGGGLITDIGGFISSTYKRGIDCIHVPTSLLAMVDASIGGKTGVNLEGNKNMIGAFYLPQQIFIDYDFLDTLPAREIYSGYAEMVKHGLLHSEKKLLELLAVDLTDDTPWETIIPSSVAIKQSYVENDFHEKGIRKALNLGHTIGHAIESYSLEKHADCLLHGEAVAWGMSAELSLSVQFLNFPTHISQQVRQFVETNYPKIHFQSGWEEEVLSFLRNDKKNNIQSFQFSLLENVGKPVCNVSISEKDVLASIADLTSD